MDSIANGFSMFISCLQCNYSISYNTKVSKIVCPSCGLDYDEVV